MKDKRDFSEKAFAKRKEELDFCLSNGIGVGALARVVKTDNWDKDIPESNFMYIIEGIDWQAIIDDEARPRPRNPRTGKKRVGRRYGLEPIMRFAPLTKEPANGEHVLNWNGSYSDSLSWLFRAPPGQLNSGEWHGWQTRHMVLSGVSKESILASVPEDYLTRVTDINKFFSR